MNSPEFHNWLYRMWSLNRDERMNYKEKTLTFEEYCESNMAWLKLKYEEQKQRGKND